MDPARAQLGNSLAGSMSEAVLFGDFDETTMKPVKGQKGKGPAVGAEGAFARSQTQAKPVPESEPQSVEPKSSREPNTPRIFDEGLRRPRPGSFKMPSRDMAPSTMEQLSPQTSQGPSQVFGGGKSVSPDVPQPRRKKGPMVISVGAAQSTNQPKTLNKVEVTEHERQKKPKYSDEPMHEDVPSDAYQGNNSPEAGLKLDLSPTSSVADVVHRRVQGRSAFSAVKEGPSKEDTSSTASVPPEAVEDLRQSALFRAGSIRMHTDSVPKSQNQKLGLGSDGRPVLVSKRIAPSSMSKPSSITNSSFDKRPLGSISQSVAGAPADDEEGPGRVIVTELQRQGTRHSPLRPIRDTSSDAYPSPSQNDSLSPKGALAPVRLGSAARRRSLDLRQGIEQAPGPAPADNVRPRSNSGSRVHSLKNIKSSGFVPLSQAEGAEAGTEESTSSGEFKPKKPSGGPPTGGRRTPDRLTVGGPSPPPPPELGAVDVRAAQLGRKSSGSGSIRIRSENSDPYPHPQPQPEDPSQSHVAKTEGKRRKSGTAVEMSGEGDKEEKPKRRKSKSPGPKRAKSATKKRASAAGSEFEEKLGATPDKPAEPTSMGSAGRLSPVSARRRGSGMCLDVGGKDEDGGGPNSVGVFPASLQRRSSEGPSELKGLNSPGSTGPASDGSNPETLPRPQSGANLMLTNNVTGQDPGVDDAIGTPPQSQRPHSKRRNSPGIMRIRDIQQDPITQALADGLVKDGSVRLGDDDKERGPIRTIMPNPNEVESQGPGKVDVRDYQLGRNPTSEEVPNVDLEGITKEKKEKGKRSRTSSGGSKGRKTPVQPAIQPAIAVSPESLTLREEHTLNKLRRSRDKGLEEDRQGEPPVTGESSHEWEALKAENRSLKQEIATGQAESHRIETLLQMFRSIDKRLIDSEVRNRMDRISAAVRPPDTVIRKDQELFEVLLSICSPKFEITPLSAPTYHPSLTIEDLCSASSHFLDGILAKKSAGQIGDEAYAMIEEEREEGRKGLRKLKKDMEAEMAEMLKNFSDETRALEASKNQAVTDAIDKLKAKMEKTHMHRDLHAKLMAEVEVEHNKSQDLLRTELKSALAESNEEMTEMHLQLQRYQSQVKELSNEIQGAQEAIKNHGSLQEAYTNLMNAFEEQKEELARAREDVAAMHSANAEMEKRMADLGEMAKEASKPLAIEDKPTPDMSVEDPLKEVAKLKTELELSNDRVRRLTEDQLAVAARQQAEQKLKFEEEKKMLLAQIQAKDEALAKSQKAGGDHLSPQAKPSLRRRRSGSDPPNAFAQGLLGGSGDPQSPLSCDPEAAHMLLEKMRNEALYLQQACRRRPEASDEQEATVFAKKLQEMTEDVLSGEQDKWDKEKTGLMAQIRELSTGALFGNTMGHDGFDVVYPDLDALVKKIKMDMDMATIIGPPIEENEDCPRDVNALKEIATQIAKTTIHHCHSQEEYLVYIYLLATEYEKQKQEVEQLNRDLRQEYGEWNAQEKRNLRDKLAAIQKQKQDLEAGLNEDQRDIEWYKSRVLELEALLLEVRLHEEDAKSRKVPKKKKKKTAVGEASTDSEDQGMDFADLAQTYNVGLKEIIEPLEKDKEGNLMETIARKNGPNPEHKASKLAQAALENCTNNDEFIASIYQMALEYESQKDALAAQLWELPLQAFQQQMEQDGMDPKEKEKNLKMKLAVVQSEKEDREAGDEGLKDIEWYKSRVLELEALLLEVRLHEEDAKSRKVVKKKKKKTTTGEASIDGEDLGMDFAELAQTCNVGVGEMIEPLKKDKEGHLTESITANDRSDPHDKASRLAQAAVENCTTNDEFIASIYQMALEYESQKDALAAELEGLREAYRQQMEEDGNRFSEEKQNLRSKLAAIQSQKEDLEAGLDEDKRDMAWYKSRVLELEALLLEVRLHEEDAKSQMNESAKPRRIIRKKKKKPTASDPSEDLEMDFAQLAQTHDFGITQMIGSAKDGAKDMNQSNKSTEGSSGSPKDQAENAAGRLAQAALDNCTSNDEFIASIYQMALEYERQKEVLEMELEGLREAYRQQTNQDNYTDSQQEQILYSQVVALESQKEDLEASREVRNRDIEYYKDRIFQLESQLKGYERPHSPGVSGLDEKEFEMFNNLAQSTRWNITNFMQSCRGRTLNPPPPSPSPNASALPESEEKAPEVVAVQLAKAAQENCTSADEFLAQIFQMAMEYEHEAKSLRDEMDGLKAAYKIYKEEEGLEKQVKAGDAEGWKTAYELQKQEESLENEWAKIRTIQGREAEALKLQIEEYKLQNAGLLQRLNVDHTKPSMANRRPSGGSQEEPDGATDKDKDAMQWAQDDDWMQTGEWHIGTMTRRRPMAFGARPGHSPSKPGLTGTDASKPIAAGSPDKTAGDDATGNREDPEFEGWGTGEWHIGTMRLKKKAPNAKDSAKNSGDTDKKVDWHVGQLMEAHAKEKREMSPRKVKAKGNSGEDGDDMMASEEWRVGTPLENSPIIQEPGAEEEDDKFMTIIGGKEIFIGTMTRGGKEIDLDGLMIQGSGIGPGPSVPAEHTEAEDVAALLTQGIYDNCETKEDYLANIYQMSVEYEIQKAELEAKWREICTGLMMRIHELEDGATQDIEYTYDLGGKGGVHTDSSLTDKDMQSPSGRSGQRRGSVAPPEPRAEQDYAALGGMPPEIALAEAQLKVDALEQELKAFKFGQARTDSRLSMATDSTLSAAPNVEQLCQGAGWSIAPLIETRTRRFALASTMNEAAAQTSDQPSATAGEGEAPPKSSESEAQGNPNQDDSNKNGEGEVDLANEKPSDVAKRLTEAALNNCTSSDDLLGNIYQTVLQYEQNQASLKDEIVAWRMQNAQDQFLQEATREAQTQQLQARIVSLMEECKLKDEKLEDLEDELKRSETVRDGLEDKVEECEAFELEALQAREKLDAMAEELEQKDKELEELEEDLQRSEDHRRELQDELDKRAQSPSASSPKAGGGRQRGKSVVQHWRMQMSKSKAAGGPGLNMSDVGIDIPKLAQTSAWNIAMLIQSRHKPAESIIAMEAPPPRKEEEAQDTALMIAEAALNNCDNDDDFLANIYRLVLEYEKEKEDLQNEMWGLGQAWKLRYEDEKALMQSNHDRQINNLSNELESTRVLMHEMQLAMQGMQGVTIR